MLDRFGSNSLEERCDEFWKWFAENSARLLALPGQDLAESGVIGPKLRQVATGLVYEIDTANPAARELVISADGVRDRFEAVRTLVDRAPALSGWKFTPFRQRQAKFAENSIKMDGMTIRGADITCSLRASNNHIHVELFVPGCPAKPDAAFVGISFLFIESAIGEFDATTKLGQVDIMAPERRGRGLKRVPLAKFREDFDDLYRKVCIPSK